MARWIRILGCLLFASVCCLAQDVPAPLWQIAEIPVLEKDKEVNRLAAQGYRIVFASPRVALMKRVTQPPELYHYQIVSVEWHEKGCFNQMNAIGAQSYGVLLFEADTIIFEKDLLPRNHHYHVGHDPLPEADKPKPADAQDPIAKRMKVQMVPSGPAHRMLQARPFYVVEVDGEFTDLDRNSLKPYRALQISRARNDDKIVEEMNRDVAAGYGLCQDHPYRSEIAFCPAAAPEPQQYAVVKMNGKYPAESEYELKQIGANGYHVSPVESSSSGRVILERRAGSQEKYDYQILTIDPLTSGLSPELEKAEADGFVPALVTYTSRNRLLVLQRKMESKP